MLWWKCIAVKYIYASSYILNDLVTLPAEVDHWESKLMSFRVWYTLLYTYILFWSLHWLSSLNATSTIFILLVRAIKPTAVHFLAMQTSLLSQKKCVHEKDNKNCSKIQRFLCRCSSVGVTTSADTAQWAVNGRMEFENRLNCGILHFSNFSKLYHTAFLRIKSYVTSKFIITVLQAQTYDVANGTEIT